LKKLDEASAAELEDAKLVGKVLHGPAGEVVHGVVKAPQQRDVIGDPAAWDEQRRTERAARDELRAPYLAPDRRPVRITRVATRGKTQLPEIADYLASSGLAGRPDLVYGAYRVPDLISPSSFGSERGSPGDGLGGLWLLIGGSVALVLGVPVAMRWRAGTLERTSVVPSSSHVISQNRPS
jgi:hypothetical protein